MKYCLKPRFSISESILLGNIIRLCNWIRTHPRNIHSSHFHLLEESRDENYVFFPMKNNLKIFNIYILDWIPLPGDAGFIIRKRSVLVYRLCSQFALWHDVELRSAPLQYWAPHRMQEQLHLWECLCVHTPKCKWILKCWPLPLSDLFLLILLFKYSDIQSILRKSPPCLFLTVFFTEPVESGTVWLPLSFRVADAVCFLFWIKVFAFQKSQGLPITFMDLSVLLQEK